MTIVETMNRLASSTSPYLRQHADNPVDWWEWSRRGVRRGPPPRRAGPAVGRLRGLPLVPRHGARVVRGRAGRRADERELRQHQGRPRGAAGHRRRLHGRDHGADRARRLADDLPAHARRRAVLRRHVLPARAVHRAARRAVAQAWRGDRAEVLRGRAARGRRAGRACRLPRAQAAPLPDARRPRHARSRQLATHVRPRARRASAGRRSSRRRWCWSSCCASTSAPATRRRWPWPSATFEAMARGGMYDQLGGGFARYSVDPAWVVPHFEKMLYDNALLLRAYLHWHAAHRSPARRAGGARDRRLPAARPAHRRGRVRLGARRRHRRRRGADLRLDAGAARRGARRRTRGAAAALFEVTAEGTFEHGASTLQLLHDPADAAQWTDLRTRLFAARTLRPQPARDDKVVTRVERAGDRRAGRGRRAAGRAAVPRRRASPARSCCSTCTWSTAGCAAPRATARSGPRPAWPRTTATSPRVCWRCTRPPATRSGCARRASCSTSRWRTSPTGTGGFYDTADDAEQLVRRPRDPTDNATPSGASALAGALLAYSALTGSSAHRTRGRGRAARGGRARRSAQPRFFGWALAAAEALVAGPVQVAVVGEPGGGPLTDTARRLRAAGRGGRVGRAGRARAAAAGRPAAGAAARAGRLRVPRAWSATCR